MPLVLPRLVAQRAIGNKRVAVHLQAQQVGQRRQLGVVQRGRPAGVDGRNPKVGAQENHEDRGMVVDGQLPRPAKIIQQLPRRARLDIRLAQILQRRNRQTRAKTQSVKKRRDASHLRLVRGEKPPKGCVWTCTPSKDSVK